jgi:hypothetical protein
LLSGVISALFGEGKQEAAAVHEDLQAVRSHKKGADGSPGAAGDFISAAF